MVEQSDKYREALEVANNGMNDRIQCFKMHLKKMGRKKNQQKYWSPCPRIKLLNKNTEKVNVGKENINSNFHLI